MSDATSGPRHLRVLLVSPLPDVDPFNGDVVYTQTLLSHPPPGVEYVTYTQAIEDGELVEHGRRRAVRQARGFRAKCRELVHILRSRLIDTPRRLGVLFREPFRDLEIRGDFDLVHCHVYSARWSGVPTPLVVSNALPLPELYRKARGWEPRRVRRATRIDTALARRSGAQFIASGLPGANGIVAFTDRLRSWYEDAGARPEIISVVPCSPGRMPGRAVEATPDRVGFVANDFQAKGGATLLQSWPAVLAKVPNATLVIAGSAERPTNLPDGVSWLGPVERRRLLSDVLPSFQVLAYPSHFDGLPLTVLEALAVGVPVIVSDYFALPELVGTDQEAGRVVGEGDHAALAAAVVELLDETVRAAVARAALERYNDRYSPDRTAELLRLAYDRAMADFSCQGRR